MTISVKRNNFKEARFRMGFSIRGLSKAANVSAATVFKIENGTMPLPSTAKKVCEALNCNFEDIFEILKEEAYVKS